MMLVLNKKNYIHYGKETSVWNALDGNDRDVTLFEIMLKRSMGSQYLNTYSLGLSEASGCNYVKKEYGLSVFKYLQSWII